jgi:tripartite-type tricarboxylate transporter receptor subunit TctC
MTISILGRVATFAAVVLTVLSFQGAQAQQWPTRQITFLYGNQPGGVLDTLARMYAERVQRAVGQPVVLEVKAGAGGAIAAQALVQARPDGHTIMLALGGMHTINPHLQPLPFHPIDDFELVTTLFSFPVFLAVRTSSPIMSVQDLVVRSKQGQGLSYGSPSPGSPMHLMGELFREASGGTMVHVGYRGGPLMLAALLAGEVEFGWPSYSQLRANLDKLRPLAITDDKRSPLLPNVPTFAEAGYSNINLDTWFGITTTKGTPPAVVERLRQEFQKAGRDPEIQKRIVEEGYIHRESTAAEFKALMVADYERLGAIIKRNNIKPN